MLNPDIIPFSPSETNSWQHEIANSFKNIDELLDYLNILPEEREQFKNLSQFPLKVTRFYAQLIKKNNVNDPLLLQVIPQSIENNTHPDFHSDAVGDLSSIKAPGLIHKYQGRVLISLTAACGIHCRYCFRREFPYSDNTPDLSLNGSILNYLKQHQDIDEVILSGGDPLMLSDKKFNNILQSFNLLTNIKTIRIHTRMPSVLPSRITTALLNNLKHCDKNIIIVLHINHPQEIDENIVEACQQLKQIGVTLLNQSVLLKNINNSSEILQQLSQTLFNAGILPYYLHCLDKVTGTSHFDTPRQRAISLINQLREKLPGYLVPKLVEEIAGKASKTHII